uniref:C2H2-type domain-containing protein n=1 Tax=Scophthalmus maximus TaxID=52904 RepID=A0A8D3E7D7_SCOMX
MHGLTCREEVFLYNVKVQKQKLRSDAETSTSTASSDSRLRKKVDVWREKETQNEEDGGAVAPSVGLNPYACAENLFYCQKCNYGNPTLKGVLNHQAKAHQVKAEYIHQHTSELLSQMGRSPRKSSAISASSSLTATEAQRILQCHRCAYNTPYVYMLRRHMWKIHRSNNSMNDILKVCFKRGMLGSGYHCDWCVFSHQNAADLFKHYREKHPENKQSLECISSRLYVGPDIVLSRKRKSQTTFGPNETKTYSCRACSFKGSSMSSITSHYRAVHPWSVKDDGSVLNVITSKKPSANSHIADDQDETPEFFDAYQVPLEFGNSPGSPHDGTDSPTMLKCHHCPATFSNHHGLKTHCGIKHPEAETKTPGRAHVFNCPYCSYVNSGNHGILTHCQMRHPDLECRADSHQVDETNSSFSRVKDCVYKCVLCPRYYFTKTHLGSHYAKKHGKNAYIKYFTQVYKQVTNKSEPTSPDCPLTQQPENTPEVSESSAVTEDGKILVYKCPSCDYVNASYHGILTHCQMKHPTVLARADDLKTDEVLVTDMPAASKHSSETETEKWPHHSSRSSELPYKCGMCSYSAICRKYLYCHYKNTHKLDALGTFNLLKRYNKRKRKAPKAKSEGSATVQCKKCPDLMFDSAQLLIDHYTTFHGSDCKSDFIVLSQRSQRSSGIYKCAHCRKQLYGIRKLCRHLDRHRARRKRKAMAAKAMASVVMTATSSVDASIDDHCCVFIFQICQQDELPLLETVQDLTRWNVALVKTFSLQTSPLPSPSKPADPEPPEPSEESKRTCRHCGRTFMSLKGLRSHERSHAALASAVCHTVTGSLYLEPPDVQRQLNHYMLMAQTGDASKVNQQIPDLNENGLLHCEFCNFNTGHMSSVRRHYLNRHGKKILRCKDCSFFTALRKTLEMHMETGHSMCQSEPTHQKDLRCPFCLYQTKNKNNMIDHIVLHREERVVPIEVCRPKLSRYLQGVVFRCHKCTFTSGCAENLRLHMMKHDDIKPYKCRLCYFDCTLLSDLEAHLSDKHQVRICHSSLLCITGIPLCVMKLYSIHFECTGI